MDNFDINVLTNILKDFINDIISFQYYLSILLGTSLIINLIDWINKQSIVPIIWKKLITVFNGVMLGFMFYKFGDDVRTLITTFLFAVFSYDSGIKLLLEKFGLGYRKQITEN